MKDPYPYVNGQVFATPMFHRCVITYLGDDKFCLLAVDKGRHGGMVAMPYSERDNKWQYTKAELPKRLKRWKHLGPWLPNEWDGMAYGPKPTGGSDA